VGAAQITALTCASSRCAVLLSHRLRRLLGPRDRVGWLPERPHPCLEHIEPRLESERLRSSPQERRARGHRASLKGPIRPSRHQTRDGPNGQENRLIRINAPHRAPISTRRSGSRSTARTSSEAAARAHSERLRDDSTQLRDGGTPATGPHRICRSRRGTCRCCRPAPPSPSSSVPRRHSRLRRSARTRRCRSSWSQSPRCSNSIRTARSCSSCGVPLPS